MKKRMEQLIGLGSIRTQRQIPGTQPGDDREFMYVCSPDDKQFPTLFKKLIRHITPPIVKDGGAVVEGCVLQLPNGSRYHAISFRGDIEGWRKQIGQGADALGVPLARISRDLLALQNGESVPLSACEMKFY